MQNCRNGFLQFAFNVFRDCSLIAYDGLQSPDPKMDKTEVSSVRRAMQPQFFSWSLRQVVTADTTVDADVHLNVKKATKTKLLQFTPHKLGTSKVKGVHCTQHSVSTLQNAEFYGLLIRQ